MSTPDSGSQPTPPPSEQRIPQPPVAQQQFPPPQQFPGQQPYPMPQPGYQAPQSFPAPPKRSRGATVFAIVAGVFAVLFLAGTIGAGVLYTGEHDKVSDLDAKVSELTATASRRDTAQQAACHFVSIMSNYSYTDLDGYFKAVLDVTTDSFRKTFDDSAGALRGSMTASQTHSTGSDIHCGTTSLTADTAEVLVTVKQAITNINNSQPSANVIPMLVSLRAQPDGGWLVSDANTVAK